MLEETLPAGEGSVQSSPPTVGKAPHLMSAFQIDFDSLHPGPADGHGGDI